MDQTVFNIILGGVSSILGWFLRTLWEATQELKSDLSKLREELPVKYVLKDDIERRFERIEVLLDKIWTKLDGKADRHG